MSEVPWQPVDKPLRSGEQRRVPDHLELGDRLVRAVTIRREEGEDPGEVGGLRRSAPRPVDEREGEAELLLAAGRRDGEREVDLALAGRAGALDDAVLAEGPRAGDFVAPHEALAVQVPL